MNELVFLAHIFTIALASVGALLLGKEALIGLISILAILANLFVCKQINLCGLTVTSSDALAVGIALSLNLLQEYYGRKTAQKAFWISFAGAFFYTLMSQFHLAYNPAAFDMMHGHYCAILSHMPRIIFASFVTYFIAQQLDMFLFGWLKQRFSGKYFIARNYFSVGICQLVDTILFSFLGLYGIVEHINHVILFSFAIKCLVILLATPAIWACKRIVLKSLIRKKVTHEAI